MGNDGKGWESMGNDGKGWESMLSDPVLSCPWIGKDGKEHEMLGKHRHETRIGNE
jgi:hypothetical protein